MRILICLPFEIDAHKGNSVAAWRLRTGFGKRNHETEIIDERIINEPSRIRERVQTFAPDLVLVLHAWRCARAVRVIQAFPVPLVVSMRGTDLNEMLDDSETGPELGEILSLAAGIVVFHEKGKTRLSGYDPAWGGKTVVIPNGIELSNSNVDYRGILGIPSTSFVFVSVSGLREVKRPLFIIPSLEEFRKEDPRIVWLHAGPPLEKETTERLTQYLEKEKSEKWLFHLDSVPHDRIDSFLRAGDIFVSASRSEGMPHSVREAMLASVPLLLSDIEGHRNMALPDKEGIFFTGESDFQRKARILIDSPDVRKTLATNARSRVTKELLESDEISLYLDFFRDLLVKGNSHG